MNRFSCILAGSALVLGTLFAASLFAAEEKLPNILWITAEDINPHLGCYGDRYADTPNLDRFATGALRYRNCWSTAPVCAPARTTIISGVYPTSSGAEHMRSLVRLPDFMKMYPQFLRERGYYCSNNAKEDYNLREPGKVWDESSKKAHWRNRQPDQPFFAVFNIETSHESQIRTRPHRLVHDPAKAPLPAYHPDTPEVRHDWAQYYDKITEMDAKYAARLKELEDDGLARDTIVFFYGDNGSGMPRSKRWPFNSGLNIPLIVRVPEKFKSLAPTNYLAGGASDRLVGFIDLAPTLLSLAGMQPPDWMQGHAFMGRFATPPTKYLHGFRGRMDERYDLVRSVRNQRFIYVRNYMPHLIYGQYIDFMFQTPTTRAWKKLYDDGQLRPPRTFFWEPKPPEELYDLQADPSEVINLVDSPAHQTILRELREAQRQHALAIRDVGFLSEAEMHSRSAGTSIYELGHDAKRYPLEKILAMADAASLLRAEALPQLRQGLNDSDSAVRYWAVMGFLMRGTHAVEAARTDLRKALADESPSVRVTAARALGQHGNAEDLQLALSVLRQLAAPDKNGAYVSLLAMNAIDALGDKASSLREMVKSMPTKDPNAVGRANGYVARLVEKILNTEAK
ncbi:MAG: sulfatase-like hydrolase/transferase [Verrucomicrobia bacterium]|nr:sulfatase-like hydrolase/transferase [Verrucomicrobiota bacterium]